MTTTLRYCENAATVARKFQEENEQKKRLKILLSISVSSGIEARLNLSAQ